MNLDHFLKFAAAAGMLASYLFAFRPLWFLARIDRKYPRRWLWRNALKVLVLCGFYGWFSFFREGIWATLDIDEPTLAVVMTVGLMAIIYESTVRAETLALQEKIRLQAEQDRRRS